MRRRSPGLGWFRARCGGGFRARHCPPCTSNRRRTPDWLREWCKSGGPAAECRDGKSAGPGPRRGSDDHPLRLGERRRYRHAGVSRHRMGRAAARRPRAVRAADPGGRAGRPVLAHGSAPPPGLSRGVPTGSTSNASPAWRTPNWSSCWSSSGIIRNRQKVFSARANAQAALRARETHGSLDAFLWRFVDGTPVVNRWTESGQVPATSPLSDRMSKDAAQGRVQLRRLDDLLFLHAGDRYGERSPDLLLPSHRLARSPAVRKHRRNLAPGRCQAAALHRAVRPRLGHAGAVLRRIPLLRRTHRHAGGRGLPRDARRRRHPDRGDGRGRRGRPGDRHPGRI